MATYVRPIRGLLLALALAAAACEEERDPTNLFGYLLDMTVDTKVAGGLPALTVDSIRFTAASPSQLFVSLRFLDPVQGGAYQLFLVTLDGRRSVPARGDYTTVRADTVRVSRDSLAVNLTVENRGKASGTAGGPPNVTHRFAIQEADLLPDSLDHFAYLVVAVQGAGTALDPAAPAPLWFKYRDERVPLPRTSAWLTGTASFGRFVAGGTPYRYAPGGQGLGSFFESRLVVNLSHLPRPPLGYAYHAWLVRRDGSAAHAGPLLSPYPELASLDGADAAAPSVVVQETEIVYATVRTDEGALGAPFHSFDQFLVTLELKAGQPARGPASVLGADLPGAILARRQR